MAVVSAREPARPCGLLCLLVQFLPLIKCIGGTRQRRYSIASRKADAVVIVSAWALMVRSPILGSVAQYGTSPQRIITNTGSLVSRLRRMISWKVCVGGYNQKRLAKDGTLAADCLLSHPCFQDGKMASQVQRRHCE